MIDKYYCYSELTDEETERLSNIFKAIWPVGVNARNTNNTSEPSQSTTLLCFYQNC